METIMSIRFRLPYFIRRRYYRLRLFRRFMKYDYWGAWEMVEPIMEIPFEIFCEYYAKCDIANKGRLDLDKEDDFAKAFAGDQNERYDEQDRLYKWWTVEYKRRQEEMEQLLDEWFIRHVTWMSPCEHDGCVEYKAHNTRYGEYLFKLLHDEEKKFEDEKEQNLIALIKLRNSLWT